MATRKQHGVIGRGPVVTVRLEHELVERLDALAERTGRSRGTYLRMALWAMIPTLERMHWEQVSKDFESLAIKDAFEEITLGLMEDAINADRYHAGQPASDSPVTRTPYASASAPLCGRRPRPALLGLLIAWLLGVRPVDAEPCSV